MRKILPLFLVIGLLTVGVYALMPNLFPDTATFPRVPTGEGTIGKVLTILLGTSDLANYSSDGSVPNTKALSGVTASGYLKVSTDCPGTQKFIGVDVDGNRICGGASVLLTEYGKVQVADCEADYYRIDESQGKTSTGFRLMAGDIIKTPVGCTLTIAFADDSIIRIDGDTTVSFDLGSLPDNTTIASAIISEGSIWGRILTETGSYTIGSDTVAVGVRGTSLSVISTGHTLGPIGLTSTGWNFTRLPGPNKTQIQIVDSRLTNAATVQCRDYSNLRFYSLLGLSAGQGYHLNEYGCNPMVPDVVNTSLSSVIYGDSPWIRKNTRDDIVYMYRLLSLSGTNFTTNKRQLLQNEIEVTIPEVVTTGGDLSTQGTAEASTLCESGERWWNERYGCQDSKIVAMADFSLPDFENECTSGMKIATYPGRLASQHMCFTRSGGTIISGVGLKIGAIDQLFLRISPELTSLNSQIGGFSGKIISYELAEYTGGGGNRVFEFGGSPFVQYLEYYDQDYFVIRRNQLSTSSSQILYGNMDGATSGISTNGLSGRFEFMSNITKFYIGNESGPTPVKGIQGTIKKLKISIP